MPLSEYIIDLTDASPDTRELIEKRIVQTGLFVKPSIESELSIYRAFYEQDEDVSAILDLPVGCTIRRV